MKLNRKNLVVLTVVGGALALSGVSLANAGSAGVARAHLPGEAKTLNAHPMSTAAGTAFAGKASAKNSQFGLRYLAATINVAPGDTDGGAIKCPKNWHPVSGIFAPDSSGVVVAGSAPISARAWAVFVLNEGSARAKVAIGAVCEKGLPGT